MPASSGKKYTGNDVAIIIPARNEKATIGQVVQACRQSKYGQTVIVVDDGSTDATAEEAEKTSAKVIRRIKPDEKGSKAQAMSAGVDATDKQAICFVDADLNNLTPSQVDGIIKPILEGRAELSCGMFDYGLIRNAGLVCLPPLTGQRAMPRWVFEAVPAERRVGYQIEIMINEVIAEGRHRTIARVLHNVYHRTKRDKLGRLAGWKATWQQVIHLWQCWNKVRYRTWPLYLKNLTVLLPLK